MTPDKITEIMATMQSAALEADTAVRKIYDVGFTISQKSDGTPVTQADNLAEEIILKHLAPLGIPVLAEESASAGYIPELGNTFFVVDPLDGTKEFIKKNGEFTVNIALIENGRPICGIITAPALNIGYQATPECAFSFPIIDGKPGMLTPLHVSSCNSLHLVCSRSHADPRLQELTAKLTDPSIQNVGSSLKLCLLASGKAQLYPRFSPTCEWDIAAGEAILQAAGGIIISETAEKLTYGNLSKNFRHPPFVAANSEALALKTLDLMSLTVVPTST